MIFRPRWLRHAHHASPKCIIIPCCRYYIILYTGYITKYSVSITVVRQCLFMDFDEFIKSGSVVVFLHECMNIIII